MKRLVLFCAILLACTGTCKAHQQQNFGGSGGGITSVTSLPATCTPGVTANVNLTINGTGYGEFSCATTNVWAPMNPSNKTVSPFAYGAKADVKYTYSANFTSGSGIVTCTAGDCSFQCPGGVYPCSTPGVTGTDVGKIAFGTTLSPFVGATPSGTLLIAQTTIASVQSATQVTTTATASNNCAPSGTVACGFAWGSQDDATAINSAATAAWSTPGFCYALQLPTSQMFIGGPVMNVTSANLSSACGGVINGTSGVDTNQVGPTAYGQGQNNSVLIPLPNYNFAGCTFLPLINSYLNQQQTPFVNAPICNGSTPNLYAHDFGINGLGQSLSGQTQAVTLFGLTGSGIAANNGCTGSTGTNLTFSNWGSQLTNSLGLGLGAAACGDPTYTNIISESFGAINCEVVAQGLITEVNGLACFGNTVAAAFFIAPQAGSGGVINSFGSYYGGAQVAGPTIDFFNSSNGSGQNAFIFNSKGDTILQQFAQAGPTAVFANTAANGTANFDGTNIIMNSGNTAASQAFFLNSTSGFTVHLTHTTVTATGANNKLFNIAASNKIFDDGGNTLFPGTLANTLTGNAFGFTNSANGTACATGNFSLTSGWGTSSVASVAANGNILGCHVSITGAAGAAGPTLTWTYPAAPAVTPASCHISGGAFGTLTGAQSGTPGATSVLFTFTGTPSAQTYTLDVGCP